MIPAPSPKGTNRSRLFLIERPGPRDDRFPLAIDELPGSNTPLARAIRQRMLDGNNDEQVNSLLEQLTERHGDPAVVDEELFAQSRFDLESPGKQKPLGSADEEEEANGEANGVRERLAKYLRGRGLSEDDIRTACDLSLGVGKSAKFGGALTGSNFGGNLSSSTRQPTSSPPVKDRAMTYEESAGQCPYAGGDSRRSPGRDSFDAIFGRQDRVQQIREATRRRKPRTANSLAMDEQRRANFHQRFPESKRIRGAI